MQIRLTSRNAAFVGTQRARITPVSDEEPSAGRAPIDDGWEPEPERPPLSARFGGGPVEYFRAVPARFFAWVGGIVFVGGWVLAVYISWFADEGPGGIGIEAYRLQMFVNTGMFVTIAAGILWAVAAFLWVKVLPASAADAPDTL